MGWVCAIYKELSAAITMLDERHESLEREPYDDNSYVLGRVGQHNVVIASLPDGETGTNSAKYVATQMRRSFTEIRFGLMVGVAGGVPILDPGPDIRIGDIVVNRPTDKHGGVLQYDYGTTSPDSFVPKGFLNATPQVLRTAVTTLRAEHNSQEGNRLLDYLSPTKNPKLLPKFAYPEAEKDELFEASYKHVGKSDTCADCDRSKLVNRRPRSRDPVVHYGTIGSGNQIMADGTTRDKVATKHGLLCFEMEAAGLMNTFPCLVIRGICDYADSHKNNRWKNYAAAAAAAYAKDLLMVLAPEMVLNAATIQESPVAQAVPSSSSSGDTTSLAPSSSITTRAIPHQNQPPESQNPRSCTLISWFSVFPGRFLNWDEVALGRLILNLDNPVQDFCSYTIPITPEEISVFPFEEIKPILNHNGDSLFSTILWNLISGLFPNSSMEFVAQRSIKYTLINSGDYFNRLIKNEAIQRWVERVYRKSYIYLAVSIHSIVDVSVITDRNSNTVDSILTTRQLSPGDRILAVQYRKLRIRAFDSGSNEIPELENGRWKKYDYHGIRGGEKDSLEATLDDNIDLTDLEDEYRFEIYSSDETGENYVLLVCISYSTGR